MARWATKALAAAPGLVVSTAVTLMVGPLLNPIVGSVLFFGGLLTAALLLLDVGEGAAARVLMLSRPVRPGELALLAPALTTLCRVGFGPPLIQLRVREKQPAIWAAGMGRRTVVISSGLLESLTDRVLPQDQAAAVIGHAAALTRGGWVRSDAGLAFWSLPWQLLRAVAMAVAGVARGLPMVSFAWRMRFVVIGIAVVQNSQAGLPWLAALIGAIGAVSYAMPVWERRWQQMMLHAGDEDLVEAGLSAPWVAFLRRCPRTESMRSRLQTLEAPAGPPSPIGLVVAH